MNEVWNRSGVLTRAVVLCAVAVVLGGWISNAQAQCGASSAGGCCAGNGSAFCDNEACCEAVCAVDPYCCDASGGEWDDCCANLAISHCDAPVVCLFQSCEGFCGTAAPGGCWCDESCCNLMDCCNDKVHKCAGCWPFGSAPEFVLPVFSCKSNCGGAAISGCWCDESCCHFGDCCVDKGSHCAGCGYGLGPPQFYGDWCIDNGCGGTSFSGCGCNEECFALGTCCSTICLDWDCPHLAGCIPPNPADLTGDNVVGVPDLLVLLQNWGACSYARCFVMEPQGCPGDYNHDGVVGVADLLFLLENWE